MILPPNFRITESCATCNHRSKKIFIFCDLYECNVTAIWGCDSYEMIKYDV